MAARPNPPSPGVPAPDADGAGPVVDLRERARAAAPVGDDDFAVEWLIELPPAAERRPPALV